MDDGSDLAIAGAVRAASIQQGNYGRLAKAHGATMTGIIRQGA